MEKNKALATDILVIDDELGPRESLRMMFKDEADMVFCASVDEGLEALLGGFVPDLIFMDIRMPGKNGIEGLKEIRALDPTVRVVMLTGYGNLETAQDALRLGANDYVNKPFDIREMRRLVRRHAKQSRMERRRLRLLEDLREMNARLINDLGEKARLANIGQRSNEFIHDLRNPLAIVSGYVSLLTAEIGGSRDMDDSAKQYLDVIEQNVGRCIELSQTWQRYSKEEKTVFAPVSLHKVLEEVKLGLELFASTMNVVVRFEGDGADAEVQGSETQLVRAFHNIGSNAIQATERGEGVVCVSCSCSGPEAVVRVEDNGCGIPADLKAKIFEPYFTTKGDSSGTGLGMGIARKIIQEHGGRLEVESAERKGTAVTLALPLLQASDSPP